MARPVIASRQDDRDRKRPRVHVARQAPNRRQRHRGVDHRERQRAVLRKPEEERDVLRRSVQRQDAVRQTDRQDLHDRHHDQHHDRDDRRAVLRRHPRERAGDPAVARQREQQPGTRDGRADPHGRQVQDQQDVHQVEQPLRRRTRPGSSGGPARSAARRCRPTPPRPGGTRPPARTRRSRSTPSRSRPTTGPRGGCCASGRRSPRPGSPPTRTPRTAGWRTARRRRSSRRRAPTRG